MPLFELNGEQVETEGSEITGANELLVIVPRTVALPVRETVVPAVALPVIWEAPDMVMPARVDVTFPDTFPLLPIVTVPLLTTLASLPLLAG